MRDDGRHLILDKGFLFMAYFSNGSEGIVFDYQCARCKFGQSPCPIALIQMEYNYDQHNDKTGTATKIMDILVSEDGTCSVFEMAKSDFEVDPNQLDLF